MTPPQFSDVAGLDRVKARLEQAIAAAQCPGETLGHILFLGPAGSGPAALAAGIAGALGVGLKRTRGAEIENAGDLVRLVTSLGKNDLLLIEDLHQLQVPIAAWLTSALCEFKLFLSLDQGGYTRPFRVNVPVFTLIGSAPHREQLSGDLLSLFPIIESLEN